MLKKRNEINGYACSAGGYVGAFSWTYQHESGQKWAGVGRSGKSGRLLTSDALPADIVWL